MPIRVSQKERYPADWKAISQRIRFTRAEGRCECDGRCGRGTHEGRCPNVHNGAAYGTGSRVILTTAHLDHTPENCDDSNLMAMCQGCHLHYDKDHHAETRASTKKANASALAAETTLEAYRLNAQNYLDSTPKTVAGGLKKWLDASVEGLPKNAQIFEVGSGSGRDAAYIETLGYSVRRTDVTEAFVTHLKQQGYQAETFNALTGAYPEQLDLIFADAVIVHFSPKELQRFLEKAHESLSLGTGRLAVTAKTSSMYEAVTQNRLGSPRWFYNWPLQQLQETVEEVGFCCSYSDVSDGLVSNSAWATLVFQKS